MEMKGNGAKSIDKSMGALENWKTMKIMGHGPWGYYGIANSTCGYVKQLRKRCRNGVSPVLTYW
jgi:hypothetical protein